MKAMIKYFDLTIVRKFAKIKYFLAYMLTGQLVQRLRLFYRSNTIFVGLLPLFDEPSE